jgi:hypothetical protein
VVFIIVLSKKSLKASEALDTGSVVPLFPENGVLLEIMHCKVFPASVHIVLQFSDSLLLNYLSSLLLHHPELIQPHCCPDYSLFNMSLL